MEFTMRELEVIRDSLQQTAATRSGHPISIEANSLKLRVLNEIDGKPAPEGFGGQPLIYS